MMAKEVTVRSPTVAGGSTLQNPIPDCDVCGPVAQRLDVLTKHLPGYGTISIIHLLSLEWYCRKSGRFLPKLPNALEQCCTRLLQLAQELSIRGFISIVEFPKDTLKRDHINKRGLGFDRVRRWPD
jgi:hypothetical protein